MLEDEWKANAVRITRHDALPSAGDAPRSMEWTDYNCYEGVGGDPLNAGDEPIVTVYPRDCQQACFNEYGCTAFTIMKDAACDDGSTDCWLCYLRSAVRIDECEETSDYSTWMVVDEAQFPSNCYEGHGGTPSEEGDPRHGSHSQNWLFVPYECLSLGGIGWTTDGKTGPRDRDEEGIWYRSHVDWDACDRPADILIDSDMYRYRTSVFRQFAGFANEGNSSAMYV